MLSTAIHTLSWPIRRFNPFGPIFTKELRVASRRKRNHVLRVLYLGALLLFLLMAYTTTNPGYAQGAAMRAQRQAELGYAFFLTFSMFSVIAMAMTGPILTSTAISGEKLHKTLHVLLMTPVTSWQIVSGKLFSRLLTALMLLGLSLPVLALVRLLGGVEVQQMFGVICIAIVTAMSTAALGLLLSTITTRTYAVILLAYAVELFVYAFVPFIVAMMLVAAYSNGPPRQVWRWMQWLTACNPFACTAMLAGGAPRVAGITWLPCVLVHLGFTAVLLLLSGLMLRRIARREGEAGGGAAVAPVAPVAVGVATLPLPTATEPAAALAEPLGLGAAGATPPPPAGPPSTSGVSDRPVLWRECRRPLMTRRWQRIVGVIITLGLLLFTYGVLADNNDLKDRDTQIGFAFIFHGVMTLLVCVMAGTAIAQEQEGDTWTLLLATPLTGASIVWGKFLGVLRRLAWPMALVAAHFLLFTISGVIRFETLLLILWIITTFNVIWVATGIYLSLQISKVTFAVAVNLVLPVLAYIAFPILLLIIDELTRGRQNLPDMVLSYLPYYHLAMVIERMNSSSFYLEFWHEEVAYTTFVQLVLLVGALHLLASLVILLYTSRRFDRIVGRARRGRRDGPVAGGPPTVPDPRLITVP